MKPLFGIDLGGSKIELVVLDPKTHLTLERTRIKTPAGDYLATISAIKNLTFKAIESWGEPKNLGIGIPGCICPNSGLVKNANSTCLIGEDLKKDLEIALKNKKIIIENDANCFALSESNNGAGKGFDSVFGVILGTGVGGGFVFKGNLLRGPNSISGEWGHNPMPWVSQTELEKKALLLRKNWLHRNIPIRSRFRAIL